MGTIPASENVFPIVRFAEGAAPATPPTGEVHLYALADGTLAWKDDAGTVYPLAYGAALQGHLADASDAHDASAISIADAGTYFTGTDVEAALQELGAAGGAGTLNSLTDVDTTGVADTNVLAYDSGTSTWVPAAAGGGAAGHYSPWDVPSAPNGSDIEGSAALSGNTDRNGASTSQGDGVIVTGEASATAGQLTGTDWAGTMGSDGDTWTLGIRDGLLYRDYGGFGLYIADSTPAAARSICLIHDGSSAYPQQQTWTALTTLTGQTNYTNPGVNHLSPVPVFFRVRRNTSTSFDFLVSFGGRSWHLLASAFNPGFTVARVGLAALTVTNNIETEAAMGFLRKNWTWGN